MGEGHTSRVEVWDDDVRPREHRAWLPCLHREVLQHGHNAHRAEPPDGVSGLTPSTCILLICVRRQVSDGGVAGTAGVVVASPSVSALLFVMSIHSGHVSFYTSSFIFWK
jgi:hypothetical protein